MSVMRHWEWKVIVVRVGVRDLKIWLRPHCTSWLLCESIFLGWHQPCRNNFVEAQPKCRASCGLCWNNEAGKVAVSTEILAEKYFCRNHNFQNSKPARQRLIGMALS